jgi:predicted transcriptional regulator of viral defense system
MNWNEFRKHWFELGCINVHQVTAWHPDFDRNNLIRWTARGYLIRLKRGLYAFPEYKHDPDTALYLANQLYKPSYISLHFALAFYGLIPESVVQITSVSSLKTAAFKNAFGEYSYKSVRQDLMFGYTPRPLKSGRTAPFATPEKALLDLLYLYPFYNTEQALQELRIDPDVLRNNLDRSRLESMTESFHCKALEKRVKLLLKVHTA